MSTQALVKAEVIPTEEQAPELFSPEFLIAKAIDRGMSLETLERLMAMRDKLRAEQEVDRSREAKMAFDRAMTAFQSECPAIEKKKSVMNKDGKSVRYRYAPLGDIVEQVRDLIGKHGFSHRISEAFLDRETKEAVAVCMVTHAQGHRELTERRFSLSASDYMNPAQNCASAMTFASRYAFCGAFGINTVDEDDDGQSLSKDREPERRPAEQPRQQQRPTEPTEPPQKSAPPKPTNGAAKGNLPANGAELLKRLTAYDAKLVKDGVCKPGELLEHVVAQGVAVCGYGPIQQWSGAAIQFATDTVIEFVAMRKRSKEVQGSPGKQESVPPPSDGVQLMLRVRELSVSLHAKECTTTEFELMDYLDGYMKERQYPTDLRHTTLEQVADAWKEARAWADKQLKSQPVAA